MLNVRQIKYDGIPSRPDSVKRLAFISDVHIGHPRTPTEYILKTLRKYVTNVKFMSSIDGLLVSGDLFDRLLNLAATEVDDLYDWVEELLKCSKQCNTPIRILEGTPSHDWKQSKVVAKLNSGFGVGADIQFIEALSIVDDETLGMTIGYVPDEWRESCGQTTKEFKELMATRGYDKVDLIIMHGMFEFQVPPAGQDPKLQFDSAVWEDMVRYGIVIGHDHRHKHKGKIIVPGSWERLAHNEEDEKGFLVMDIAGECVEVYHVDNDDAMWYITVDGVDKTDVEVIAEAEYQLNRFGSLEHPIGRLKVKYNRKYDIGARLAEWRTAFPDVVVEGSGVSDEVAASDMNEEFALKGEVININ